MHQMSLVSYSTHLPNSASNLPPSNRHSHARSTGGNAQFFQEAKAPWPHIFACETAISLSRGSSRRGSARSSILLFRSLLSLPRISRTAHAAHNLELSSIQIKRARCSSLSRAPAVVYTCYNLNTHKSTHETHSTYCGPGRLEKARVKAYGIIQVPRRARARARIQ